MRVRQNFLPVARNSDKAPPPAIPGELESCRRRRPETNNVDGRNFAPSLRYRETGSLRRNRSATLGMRKAAHPCDPGDVAPSSRGPRTMEVRPLRGGGNSHALSIASTPPHRGSPRRRPPRRHAGPRPRLRHRRPRLAVVPGSLESWDFGFLGPGSGDGGAARGDSEERRAWFRPQWGDFPETEFDIDNLRLVQ